MSPQQKHVIIVMVESIEHQLAALKSILASQEGDDGRPVGPAAHKSTRMPTGQAPFLDEKEEDALEDMLDPRHLQSIMDAAMKAQDAKPETSEQEG
jgi:hypothetical protein